MFNHMIKIDPEFKALIPPLGPDELRQLEENILRDGCRDPLVIWRETLIDGHNRFEICQRNKIPFETVEMEFAGRDAVMDWMDANQLGRRNLNPDQFRLLLGRRYNRQKKAVGAQVGNQNAGKQLDQIDPIVSTAEKLAAEHGVSAPTVKRAGKFAEEVEKTPELAEAIAAGKPVVQIKRELKEKKREIKKQETLSAIEQITNTDDFKSVCDIRNCSMDDLFKNLEGVDAVITDPPYPEKYLPLYEELAKHCANAGIKIVAAMAGQSYLPQIYAAMSKHLKYRWTLAYMTPGGQAVQQWQAKVNTFWKPILLFGDSDEWFGDVAISKPNDNDKRFHGWGQSESGMMDLVDRLSKPGHLVCDPFVGAGTTAIASLVLGRKFIGCDIDPLHAKTAKARALLAFNKLKS